MKLFIFILFLGITGISQAQKAKIKIDGDIVLVNGEPAFILESPILSATYNVYNMQHKLLAVFDETAGTTTIQTSSGTKYQQFSYWLLLIDFLVDILYSKNFVMLHRS